MVVNLERPSERMSKDFGRRDVLPGKVLRVRWARKDQKYNQLWTMGGTSLNEGGATVNKKSVCEDGEKNPFRLAHAQQILLSLLNLPMSRVIILNG